MCRSASVLRVAEIGVEGLWSVSDIPFLNLLLSSPVKKKNQNLQNVVSSKDFENLNNQ